MTPEQMRAAADAQYTAFEGLISARQSAYQASNSRYFQGLRSHAIIPADGVPTVADITALPYYETSPWPPELYAQPLYAAVAMDQYDGPQGQGYVVHLLMTIGGRSWGRSVNYGPESARTVSWADITPVAWT